MFLETLRDCEAGLSTSPSVSALSEAAFCSGEAPSWPGAEPGLLWRGEAPEKAALQHLLPGVSSAGDHPHSLLSPPSSEASRSLSPVLPGDVPCGSLLPVDLKRGSLL